MKIIASIVAAATFATSAAGMAGAAPARLHGLPTTSTGQWAPTATQAMGVHFTGGLDRGAVSPSMPMKVVVGLKADKAGAEAALRHMYTQGDPAFHHFLTGAQYTAAFAPKTSQVAAVAQYLGSMGFTHISAAPNNLLVRAEGNAAVVGRAFNTSIHAFNYGRNAVYMNVAPAMVPQALAGTVLGVLGLQNIPMQIHLRAPRNRAQALAGRTNTKPLAVHCITPTPVCPIRSFGSSDIRLAYDDERTVTGANTNVAVFSEGDVSDVLPDLRLNERDNGLRQVPVNIVAVDFQSADTFAQGEWTLDTQTSTGIAGDVNSLTLYNTGSLDDNDISLSFNRFVTDRYATLANASFGECEYQAELDGAMPIDDQILQQAALQGQTVFASSGDAGSSCGFNIITNGLPGAGPPQVAYPATSPYVIGVGATTLFVKSDGTYFGEIPWDAGGGGISLFEAPEFWTYKVVPYQCIPTYCDIAGPGIPVALTGGIGRSVPDISMDGDPFVSGHVYYLNGSTTVNGGTSLSSPLAMGVFSRLQSRHNNQIGFAGPALYGNYLMAGGSFTTVKQPAAGAITTPIGAFNDVLVGANGIHTAKPGYDLTTGMGTFDINNLIIWFGS